MLEGQRTTEAYQGGFALFLGIGIALIVLWIVFKVFIPLVGIAIHFALIIGILLIIWHFVRKSLFGA